jgi:hypothetical protein
VIVERDHVDPAVRQPAHDLGLGIEIVGLVPEMSAYPRQLRSQAFEPGQNGAGIFRSAQAWPHDQVTP